MNVESASSIGQHGQFVQKCPVGKPGMVNRSAVRLRGSQMPQEPLNAIQTHQQQDTETLRFYGGRSSRQVQGISD